MDNEICRLCLTPKEVADSQFKNIFTNVELFDTKQIKLVDAIMDCAPIQIRQDDNLPKLACLECIDKLQISYSFRQTCLQSDSKLKLLYNLNNNSKSIKNEDTAEESKLHHDVQVEESATDPDVVDILIKYENQSDSDHHGDKENESPDEEEEEEEGEELLKISKYQCSLCDSTFQNEGNLKKHIAEHENKTPKRAKSKSKVDTSFLEEQCKICNAPYCSKDFHLIKSREHNEGKPFICKVCGKGFKQKAHLSVHWKTHTGEKSHTCNICMKSFITKSNLKTHKINKHFKTSENKDISKELEAARKLKGNNNYICTECDEKFKSFITYKKHLEIHSGERPFVCSECGMGFKQKIHLSIHIKSHNGEKNFGCDLCSKTFTTRSVLKAHILRVHSEEDLENNAHFQNDDNLDDSSDAIKDDIKQEDGDSDQEKTPEDADSSLKLKGPYACSQCDKTFLANAALQDHLRIHSADSSHAIKTEIKQEDENSDQEEEYENLAHEDTDSALMLNKSFVCNECDKSFPSNVSLQNHLKVHSDERPFVCDVCNKGFKQKGHLTVHKRLHTGEKPYICNICLKAFVTNSEMQFHKKHRHATDSKVGRPRTQKVYHCKYCEKICHHRYKYVRHLRTHTGETPYMCEICGKAFKHNYHLKNHKRIHSGEKPYSCKLCPKTFRTGTELRVHQLVHSDELPHKCNICDKRFKWRHAALRHMMSHTEEKPHKCTLCDKAFLTSGNLKRHMRVHTGERPQQCKICHQTFTQSTHLKTHMNIHKNIA